MEGLSSAAVRQHELLAFAEVIPVVVWRTDPEGLNDYFNTAWYDYTGLTVEQSRGTGWTVAIHPEDQSRVQERWVAAVHDGALYEVEFRILGRDGAYRWFLARGRPQLTLDGTVGAWFGTATDIDAQRRASEAIDRLYALSRDNERRVAAIADAVPQIFFTAFSGGSVDWFNRRWYEYTGQTAREALGKGWEAVQHPRDLPEVQREWQRSTTTGKPFEMSHRLRGTDGVYRWFLTRVVPQLDEHGKIERWYGASTNVDAERRATLQLAFFAELGQQLTSLPTLDATLHAVVTSLVPNFADWAMVELREDGSTYVAAVEHSVPAQRDALRALIGRRTARGTTLAAGDEALRSGRPVIVYGEGPVNGANPAGFGSAVAVPLVLEPGVHGVLTLAMIDTAGAFSDADLPFVLEIARRITPALARAEIYERERRIAHTFQSAVLPRRLPEIPGLRFDALYEPGKAEALVGGDWFDAFRLADGRIVITIGDVVGSGLAAATAMSEARQSLRGAAAINPDPAILLDAADRILADHPDDRYATAWVGIADPIDFSLRYASAGHPPPYVRDAQGNVRALEGGGLPLGLAGTLAQRRSTFSTFVDPGSLLLLFTDGLIESARDALRDEAILAAALAGTSDDRAVCARDLRNAVLGAERAHDDVAILLVEFAARLTECGGDVGARRWSFDVMDEAAAGTARRELAADLTTAGMNPENVLVAELILAELLGNVVRHAGGIVDVVLDRSADVPVIHIIDAGGGFEHNPRLPADALADGGRGLFIVAELAREFTIARAPGGGSHARVVLETRGGANAGPARRRE